MITDITIIRTVCIFILIAISIIVIFAMIMDEKNRLKPFPTRRQILRADYDKTANWIISLPEPGNKKQVRSHARIQKKFREYTLESMGISKRKHKVCRTCQNN